MSILSMKSNHQILLGRCTSSLHLQLFAAANYSNSKVSCWVGHLYIVKLFYMCVCVRQYPAINSRREVIQKRPRHQNLSPLIPASIETIITDIVLGDRLLTKYDVSGRQVNDMKRSRAPVQTCSNSYRSIRRCSHHHHPKQNPAVEVPKGIKEYGQVEVLENSINRIPSTVQLDSFLRQSPFHGFPIPFGSVMRTKDIHHTRPQKLHNSSTSSPRE